MRTALTLAALVAFPAAADTTYIIHVSNRVTPAQPSATIEVLAVFDENLDAFAGAGFEFIASPHSGGFSDPERLLAGPGTQDGVVGPDGDSVTGIIAGQLCFPIIGVLPDPSNPILIWRAMWSSGAFDGRAVLLATDTSKFDVYFDNECNGRSDLDKLVEGSGVIEVGCYADCTGDGSVDLFDFLWFTNQFNAGASIADCDDSGGLDLFDFLCFVNAFNTGC